MTKWIFARFRCAHVCSHHPLCARLRRMSLLFDVYHFVCATRRFIRLSVSRLERIVFARKKEEEEWSWNSFGWQINLKLLFAADRDASRANKTGEICLAKHETFQFQIDRISYCSIFRYTHQNWSRRSETREMQQHLKCISISMHYLWRADNQLSIP